MFPQFGATAETLSKASTLVFRIGTDAHLYDDPEDVNIAPLLDSKFDSEKCEALKRLLALIAQGFDVSNFFPQVVKNVASQSLEVKKLAYLYLLHYAEKRPNEALLSINCFQKDLGDTNPLVRAWALRTMAGIRLHVIAPLVLVAVGKCARDPSVYVRKCAANALPKLHDLRIEENASTIEEIIGVLLSDHSPGVVGAAAAAFASTCPNNFSLIGKNYKRLCEILPDVEEWGQIILIEILLRYVIARHGLVKESIMSFLHSAEGSDSEKDESDSNFMAAQRSGGEGGEYHSELAYNISRSYIEGPDEYFSRSSYINGKTSDVKHMEYTSLKSNQDVKILLQCTQPLLWSYNSSVVIAAAGVHWIMASKDDVKRIVKPLLFVLRSSSASRYVVLCNIHVFAKAMPSLFAPYFEDFFINSSDSYQIRALKLDILSFIATDSSMSSILREFQDYIRDPDRRFAADAVSALGLCAQRLPLMAETCLDGLVALTKLVSLSGDSGAEAEEAGVLSQIILSIISIIKQDPSRNEKVIAQLFRSLDTIKVPAARAMIIWVVGEYNSLGEKIPKMLTTLLKYLAWCFKSEALEVKRQILITTIKVLLCAKKEEYWTFRKIVTYVLDMAECDTDYDIRDRARFLRKLLEDNIQSHGLEMEINYESNNTHHMLFEQIYLCKLKLASNEPSNCRFYLPGSLSHIVLHSAPGYEPLPKPSCWFPHNISNVGNETNATKGEASDNDSSYSHDTGSFNEESASDYSSENYNTGSSGSSDSYENESRSEANVNNDPLIQISDSVDGYKDENGAQTAQSGFDGIGELMSKRSLESWLDEGSGSSNANKSKLNHVHHSSARINIGDLGSRVKPKSFTLLDPTNSNGLKVDYSFSSEVSTISSILLCVDVFFKNYSQELMSKLVLVDDESGSTQDSSDQQTAGSESSSTYCNEVPRFIPMEEISSLEPGQTAKRIIQVHFHHHLLPLKLAVCCDGKRIPVKLRPDIGYFVRPLPMDAEAFVNKQSHLPGMFEYTRSCTFTDHLEELKKDEDGISLTKDKFLVICESLAVKVLSNVNLFLVTVDMPVHTNLDDATGLHLRFSCEILSNSIPCLVTVTLEGKCSEPLKTLVKVNCEETVFGLNLLNRIVNFLAESSAALS